MQPRIPGNVQAITLLLPVTMTVMGIVVLLPVLPALSLQFASVPHADILVPVLLTIPAAMVVLFAGAAGLLADLVGRRRLLLVSMVLYAACGTAPFFLRDFMMILATRIGVGVCEAAVLVITTTMIGDYFQGQVRDRWLAWQTGIAAVAATVLIGLAGLLGSMFGWRGPFLIYALALPLAALVFVFTWEPPREVRAAIVKAGSTWQGFAWRRMLGICAITVFSSFLFYLVQMELTVALALRGVHDPSVAGRLLAFVSVGIIAGSVVFRFLSQQKVSLLLGLEFLLIGASLVGMSQAVGVTALVVCAFASQLGAGMVLPTLLTWAVRGLSFEHRGRGSGLWQGTFSFGQFLVAISMPALNAATGSLAASFGLIGAATLAAALICACVTLIPTAHRKAILPDATGARGG